MLTNLKRPRAANVLVAGAGLALAYGLKAFYSHAGADDLLWVLGPSAWVARVLGGVDLTYEVGAGYISAAHHLVVGPPCAGVNFLLIAFLTLFFGYLPRFEGPRARLDWMAGALALAYVATVATNGVRIVLAAHLYELDIYSGGVTPGRVHRLAGTVIYYGSLLALYRTVGALLEVRGRRLLPLVCYLLIAVGVPLVTQAYDDVCQFVEHATWVVTVAASLTLLVILPGFLRNRTLADRIQWRT